MSLDCAAEYACKFTLLGLHSSLTDAKDCCVDSSAAGKSQHSVGLWNLGTGRYFVDVSGECDEPLHYPDAGMSRKWTKERLELAPRLKAEPLTIRWKIAAEESENGQPNADIKAAVLVTERVAHGGQSVPSSIPVPPNEPLRFQCIVS